MIYHRALVRPGFAWLVAFLYLLRAAGGNESPASQPTTGPADLGTKPSIRISADGFPAGHDSPEGVACDLARAFFNNDVDLFRQTSLPAFGGGDDRKAYEEFLRIAEAGLKAEAAKTTPSLDGPRRIAKLFAARHLSLNGPASTGYALFDFRDVMFVDVGVIRNNGKELLCRTLVIQKADGKWVVLPDPQAYSLLSMGLNDEKKSTQDFFEAYRIAK